MGFAELAQHAGPLLQRGDLPPNVGKVTFVGCCLRAKAAPWRLTPGVSRSVVRCVLLVAIASVVATGCFGDDFAGVMIVNSCSSPVRVASSQSDFNFGDSDWVEIAAGHQDEALLNAPAGDLIYIEVRGASDDDAARSVFIQAPDGSEVQLRNAVWPQR